MPITYIREFQMDPSVVAKSSHGTDLAVQNSVNLMKLKFQYDVLTGAIKGGMSNMSLDTFNDETGLDQKFRDYVFDATNKRLTAPATRALAYQKKSDWDQLTKFQVQALDQLKLAYDPSVPGGGPATWGAIQTANGNTSDWSSVALAPDGTAHVAWQSARINGGSNIEYATISPAGTISPVRAITSTTSNNYQVAIALAPDGTAYMVWNSYRFNASYLNIDYAMVSPSGAISPVKSITTSTTAHSQQPAIAISPAGTVHVVWQSNRITTSWYNIDYVTVSPADVVSPVTSITTSTTAASQQPAIALAPNGTAHVAWMSQRLNANIWNVEYVTISQAGVVSSLTTVTAEAYHNQYPAIAFAPDGSGVVVWQSRRFNANIWNVDYRTIAPTGVFASVKSVTSSTTYHNQFPTIAFASDSTAHVAWQSLRLNATYSNVDYATISPTGVVSPVTTITSYTDKDAFHPAIAAGNRAVVAFTNTLNPGGFMGVAVGSLASYLTSGYATGTLSSADTNRTWQSVTVSQAVSTATTLTVEYRTPGGTWGVLPADGVINLASASLEWKVSMTTTDIRQTPALNSVTFNYTQTSAEVRSTPIASSFAPKQVVLTTDAAGSNTFQVSRDGGATWTDVRSNGSADLASQPDGATLVMRAVMANGSTLDSWAITWA